MVQVVGLGTQDSYEEATDFVAAYGTESFTMLWDPGFTSWSQLGIRGQPGAILFDAEGTGRFQWFGSFDLEEVLLAAEEL